MRHPVNDYCLTAVIYKSAEFISHIMIDHIFEFFCIFGKTFESRLLILILKFEKGKQKENLKSFRNKTVTYELSYSAESFICKICI